MQTKSLVAKSFLATLIPCLAYASPGNVSENPLVNGIVLTVIYSIVGICILAFGFLVVDRITPGSLGKEITERKNVAAAIFAGAMIISIGMVIAASLLG